MARKYVTTVFDFSLSTAMPNARGNGCKLSDKNLKAKNENRFWRQFEQKSWTSFKSMRPIVVMAVCQPPLCHRPATCKSVNIRSQPLQNESIYDYVCPFCKGPFQSRVFTGEVNHRNHCGKQFMVANGVVVSARERIHRHKCPKCGVYVTSSKASGQIRVHHKNGAGRACPQTSWIVPPA